MRQGLFSRIRGRLRRSQSQADNLSDKLSALLTVGEVGLYRTIDDGYGVSVEFYDGSYYLATPADTIEDAVTKMHDEEWRITSALKYPDHLKKAYESYQDKLEEEMNE